MLGMMMDCDNYEDRKVDNTVVGDYTVDTCFTSDAGFETAIWKENGEPMVIVERYEDKDQAQVGHEKWCEFCKGNPTEVYSVQLEYMCDL
jgi:hypothetical protein